MKQQILAEAAMPVVKDPAGDRLSAMIRRKKADVAVIGGGPAGLAAAVAARKAGCEDILILERDQRLGGILNQCIHNGFGLHTFQEELTGPEYADRFIKEVQDAGIPYLCNTMVMELGKDGSITAMNREQGLFTLQAGAVILAMGCRERPRGALNTPGYRPAGIYSAGTAQHYVNIEGLMPGKEVVILGSGDIGLIMARRMTLEGAVVKAVAEIMPYSGGLKRNIVQCLDDYGIPLYLSTTVVDIKGKNRVEAVTLARVDENKVPVPGTEWEVPCDTLLLSCGLIPENELTGQLEVKMSGITGGPVVDESYCTSLEGVFACGNVLHVHDLVDYVSEEAALAGKAAAEYVMKKQMECPEPESGDHPSGKAALEAAPETEGRQEKETAVPILPERGVRYTVPFEIHPSRCDKFTGIKFRVGAEYRDTYVSVYLDEERILHAKKRILAPGEMQRVILTKAQLDKHPDLHKIRIVLETE